MFALLSTSLSTVCLHTLDEIRRLHGHYDEEPPEHVRRHLTTVTTSTDTSGYASVSIDAYSITSDSGSVSWSSSNDADTAGVYDDDVATDDSADDDGFVQEYDSYGCLVETGFETIAYPLTVKHCYMWRYVATSATTGDCAFTLDGTADQTGYVYAQTDVTSLLDSDYDLECTASISDASTGFCECGGGFKIPVGECSNTNTTAYYGAAYDASTNPYFTCETVCLEYASAFGQMTIDLYNVHDERLEKTLELDSDSVGDFFTVIENEAGGEKEDEDARGICGPSRSPLTTLARFLSLAADFSVTLQDNVYLSMRLAYRRETPIYYGTEDWPMWLDWGTEVAGYYTSDGVSADGLTWSDESTNSRDATVTNGTISTSTISTHGPEDDSVVVSGTAGTTVSFGADLIPSPLYTYHEQANFVDCDAGCIDLSDTVSDSLGQNSSFEVWLDLGAADSRVDYSTYMTACQNYVVASTDCGEYFDAFYPSFSDINTDFEAAISDLIAGLLDDPPMPAFTDSGNDLTAYTFCSSLGQDCQCSGNVRFANSDDNAGEN